MNAKNSIDAVALRDLFAANDCPGAARLVEHAGSVPTLRYAKIGVPDRLGLVKSVTNAVIKSLGIKAQFSALSPNADIIQRLLGVSALAVPEDKNLTAVAIGPFWDPSGRHVNITPLQWLEALSRVLSDLSPPAIRAIDDICARFVSSTGFTDITDTVL